MNLVFKGFFRNINSTTDFYTLCKRGYHDFPSKIFCLTVPKNFEGEPFLVSENFWYRNKLFMHKRGAVSRFSVIIIMLKNVDKGWDSSPYQPLRNDVVLPTVPWDTLEFLTNVSEIIKIFGTTETGLRTCRFRNLLS